jgi:CRISPR-associated protein Cas1
MTDRIIDISRQATRLRVDLNRLIVEQDGEEQAAVLLDDISALVISHPAVSCTHAVLSGLMAAGGAVVVCDQRHMPTGLMLPLQAHYAQAERFRRQARLPVATGRRLWQQVVRAKIRAQASVLERRAGGDAGLRALVRHVSTGDKGNVEARAAQCYWPALFGRGFRRDREGGDQNRHLNYGYAVLRAVVGRAVCAAGLHPSLGIHHHNRYDAFCLADDLMEPFRPLVDEAVARRVADRDPAEPLTSEAKADLLEALTARVELEGERRTLFDAAARCAQSLAAVVEGKAKSLLLPEL